MAIRRPPALREGDTVALLSPSWGGPSAFPKVYESGVAELRGRFHLDVREYPTTRADPIDLLAHPEERARDLVSALRDPGVQGILFTIGGDDSCRLLPLLPADVWSGAPKVMMGFSDATTLLTSANLSGWVTFHGPSVMAGISQLGSLPGESAQHLSAMLFAGGTGHEYVGFPQWSDGYPRWEHEENVGRVNPPHRSEGPRWLRGDAAVEGPLFGGCLEVLEFLKGTRFWPPPEAWRGRVLFLETSEAAPSPVQVRWALRNYGLMGVFDEIAALLVGRAARYPEARKRELDAVVTEVVADEFHHPELPVVTDLDFGHTDPQWVLPLGVRCRVDPIGKSLRLTEPWLKVPA